MTAVRAGHRGASGSVSAAGEHQRPAAMLCGHRDCRDVAHATVRDTRFLIFSLDFYATGADAGASRGITWNIDGSSAGVSAVML